MNPRLHGRGVCAGTLACLAAIAVACGDRSATAPTEPSFAASATGADPTVRSTVPASSPRDTTIQILVRGSGFDQGSRAVWALDGDTTFAATRIRTNATTFVNARELVANVTIESDAQLALYDVEVLTSRGKKGIGLELFEVTVGITILPGVGGNSAWAAAINDAGIVAGGAVDEKEQFYAVRWRQVAGIWQVEKLAGGLGAFASEMNNRGTIAGGTLHRGAVLWTQGGKLVDLGLGSVHDINEEETVVGSRPVDNAPPFNTEAAIWTKRSPSTWNPSELLPRLPNGGMSQAIGINEGGTLIVGDAWDAEGVEHAVTWRRAGGVWQTPTIIANSLSSAVTEVNSNGDVAGSGFPCGGGSVPECNGQAMFWLPDGTRLDLGALGIFSSHTEAINEAGHIVGFAVSTEYFPFPIRWSPRTGVVQDIGLPLGDLQGEARSINNRGQAVGSSIHEFPDRVEGRALLWTFRGR
jgi:uncharacterized membrane protein